MLGHGRPPGPRPGGSRPIEHVTLTLLVVLGLAVFFDYVNGFHDTANAIATSVATRALRPAYAIAMATAFNFIGAFAGTAVAKTIGAGLVNERARRRRSSRRRSSARSSGTCSRGGSACRAPAATRSSAGCSGPRSSAAGFDQLNLLGIRDKVLVPLVASPIIGFTFALVADGRPVLAVPEGDAPAADPRVPPASRCSPPATWRSPTARTTRRRRWASSRLRCSPPGVLPNADTIPWGSS